MWKAKGSAELKANEPQQGKVVSTKPKIFAGLDIGSSKVCLVIGQINEDQKIDVIGVGSTLCQGMKNGVVVDIEATTAAIQKAKIEAELMSGHVVEKVFLSIGGSHIKSFDSKGMVAITNEEISEADVKRVIEAAKAVAVPSDREVLHILPKKFKVDEQDGISAPVGMSGIRLEVSVRIITGGYTAIQNALKCAEKAGLKVDGLVLEQLASSLAILNEDEKNLGAAVIDMGSGTSDLIIYCNGSVSYTASLSIGGRHVTNDIAVGLRTPQTAAEEIKKKYGCALASLVAEDEAIEVPSVGGTKTRSVLRKHLCEIIEPRIEETLNFINNEIQASGLGEMLGAGVIVTGGASQLDGLVEMGEFVFDLPVRRGQIQQVDGLQDTVKSPSFATAVGLVKYAYQIGAKSSIKIKEDKLTMNQFFSKIRTLFGEAN
jgi:cell division protein FtsA